MTGATSGRRRRAACHPLFWSQPAVPLSASVISSCQLKHTRLSHGQTEIPALGSHRPNSSRRLREHRPRSDASGKAGAMAGTQPAPKEHRACHPGKSPSLHRTLVAGSTFARRLSGGVGRNNPTAPSRPGAGCCRALPGLRAPCSRVRSGTICKNRLQLLKC